MQPPGRISLFFVAAGSSPAGLFSVSRSVFCQSVCVAASRPAFSPAACLFSSGLPFLSAGLLLSTDQSCCRPQLFPPPDCIHFPPGLCRRPLCFVAGASALAPGSPGLSLAHSVFRRAFAFGCSALLPGHLLCAGPAGPVFGSFRFPPSPYFVGPSVCRWQRSSCRFSSRGVTGLVIRASHPASSARRRSVSKA